VCSPDRAERSPFLGEELSAGSFGCGNDLVETRVTAQRIPAWIEAEIAVGWASRGLRGNFEFLHRAVAREASSEIVNLAVALAQQNIAQRQSKLLVNGRWLGFRKKFLKTRRVTDWVPDGVDLQTRNRNLLPGRDCEQLAKYFYRLLGPASVRFDLG
jgi:hypothetical protein